MKPAYITISSLHNFIKNALAEDIGDGDHSTLASVSKQTQGSAQLLIKDEGVLAGVELAIHIFSYYDPTLSIAIKLHDGNLIKPGDIALTVQGAAASILTCERLVLNCMQRMSGIATKTNHLTKLIKDTHTKILDTRKTTPNFRLIEKWAVQIGGGENHRIGLYDMIMLKDNHIDMAGGIKNAIYQTKQYLRNTNKKLKIEVETRNLNEVKQVIETNEVDIIMLDNMDVDTMKQAVALIDGKMKTEASGGITEANIARVAACGVDYISIGALTHSYKSLDMSLKMY